MTIDEHIKHLMDTYGTTDPFKLADYLGIMIGYADGTSPQFKGVYCPYIQPVIVLRNGTAKRLIMLSIAPTSCSTP